MYEYCYDAEYKGVYWSVTYDGTPLDTTKHTYNQAFAIYALSSYYEVSKNQTALDLAYSIYYIIEEKCKDENGYLEAFTRCRKIHLSDFRSVQRQNIQSGTSTLRYFFRQ